MTTRTEQAATAHEEQVTSLVLTQSVGETIFVGDDIEVRVVAIGRDQVRLRFCAPRRVVIDREKSRDRRVAAAIEKRRGMTA